MAVFLEILALFFCGTFFGAAVYISIAQHPATLQTGVPFGAAFFPPMYGLAAPMQIVCALVGTLAGIGMYLLGAGLVWLIGAGLLLFVIPFTIVVLKPINDQLLDSKAVRSEEETAKLLNLWGPRHWIRSIASGLSFLAYLYASIAA